MWPWRWPVPLGAITEIWVSIDWAMSVFIGLTMDLSKSCGPPRHSWSAAL